jgi:hypothetical protein
MIERVLLTV